MMVSMQRLNELQAEVEALKKQRDELIALTADGMPSYIYVDDLRALLAPAPASETARCSDCGHDEGEGCGCPPEVRESREFVSAWKPASTPPTIKDTHRPGDYGTTAADFERPGCADRDAGQVLVPRALLRAVLDETGYNETVAVHRQIIDILAARQSDPDATERVEYMWRSPDGKHLASDRYVAEHGPGGMIRLRKVTRTTVISSGWEEV